MNRAVVSEAMTSVFVPVASFVGVVLLAMAVFAGNPGLAPIGVTALAVGAVGALQTWRQKPQPMWVLVVASVGVAVSVPFIERGEAVALLPAVTLFALVGVFSFSRTNAVRFILWCGLVAIWLIGWQLSDLMPREIGVGLVLLLATGYSGWRFLTIISDTLAREQESTSFLFESSPVATLEEDFSRVSEWLDRLRANGVEDLRAFLTESPDQVRYGISLIELRRANAAAARLIEAGSPDELVASFSNRPRVETELGPFVEQFVALWDRRRSLALDLHGLTLKGKPLEAVLQWSVPVIRGKADLSRVIVAITDITPRKIVEERLARAVESNERMLTFEQALASCSRALLMGVGEDALDVALEALREAIRTDRAFLAINVEDADVGPAFKVVNSASRPEFAHDDWVGLVVPWHKYPMASTPLRQGQAFQHIAADSSEEGWTRSLLAVPVFTGGAWSGTVGFVNIARKTEWSTEAVRMLEVASPMLGTFWERELTRQRLEDLVESKDRFVASISHELRTPLSAVLGFAEELKTNASSFQPHEATEILELIAEQSRDMADMVEDLLVAARADIGTISYHLQEVYLRAQAEAAIVAIGSTGTTTVEVIGGPGKAWTDPTRTRQIIRNLLTNAVRYGGETVTIEANDGDETVVLSVRDNGTGLPESEWERIFEPYERAHERPTQPSSVGLGLTVSRQLARAMGGDLTYWADTQGSTFELTLPSGLRSRDESPTVGTIRM